MHGLEERVSRLEELFGSVRGDLDGLSKRVDSGGEQASSLSARDLRDGQDQTRLTAPMPHFIGTEDSVDGMGAVTFADEEDSGFFGVVYLFLDVIVFWLTTK